MDLNALEKRIHQIEKNVQTLLLEIHQLKKNDQATDADFLKQREIARQMREARDKMPPLGMSIKEMVEDGRA